MPTSTCTVYTDIPLHYTWQTSGKKWKKRVKKCTDTISRMYAVTPKDRERLYLRMLLLHVREATSFNQLKTYEGVRHETFEGACRARGLLIDDTEWDRTLAEAITTPRQVRELFVTILGSCEPSNPVQLWEDYKSHMSEDFVFHHDLSARLADQYALKGINESLHNYRVSVSNFGFSLVENYLI